MQPPDNKPPAAPGTEDSDDGTPPTVARLLKLQDGPRDNALLRHAIGLEWLKVGRNDAAVEAFRQATERDAQFSAAWKLLGKTLFELGEADAARLAWEQGLAVASARGDVQAAKEMQVFLRRLDKASGKGTAG